MKRAMILILVLTAALFACGVLLDAWQTGTAEEYLRAVRSIRQSVLENRLEEALIEQRNQHARWQHDQTRLNCLISHHHTRAVDMAMLKLSTALEQGWDDWALRALDEVQDALTEIAQSDAAKLENIL